MDSNKFYVIYAQHIMFLCIVIHANIVLTETLALIFIRNLLTKKNLYIKWKRGHVYK